MSVESSEERRLSSEDFAREAERKGPGFVREFLVFLRENRKWWLIPIVLLLLALGGLAIVGSGVLAPFIYPLF